MISPDMELVARAVRRDPDATAELLAELRPGVVRYCRSKLARGRHGYATADDVAQEVCLAILNALPRYRERGRPFGAFVYTIAARKVTDAQRRAMRDRTVGVLDVLTEHADNAPGPEQRAVTADLSRRMFELLDRLPEPQREIIVLRIGVGLSAEEVGATLGKSAAAIRVAQSRALAQLRTLASAHADEVTL